MPDAATERALNDRLWDRVRPLLPPRPGHPKGGRQFADDRACFDGIVHVLRNGLRWRQMPSGYPLELVADANGVPLGAATDGANVHEVNPAPAALADIPATVAVPWGVPVLADRAYDSDPLREQSDRDGFELLARHRANRATPPTADGRTLRRLRRRWAVDRTFAWVKAFHRVATRDGRTCDLYDGFVSLACAFIAVARLRNRFPNVAGFIAVNAASTSLTSTGESLSEYKLKNCEHFARWPQSASPSSAGRWSLSGSEGQRSQPHTARTVATNE